MYIYYVYTVYSLFRACCPMIVGLRYKSKTGSAGKYAPPGLVPEGNVYRRSRSLVFRVEQPKQNKTTKRLGNAHFAGRAGGYAHFAGAGRAPLVFSTHSHDHIQVSEDHIRGFDDHIRVFDVQTYTFRARK